MQSIPRVRMFNRKGELTRSTAESLPTGQGAAGYGIVDTKRLVSRLHFSCHAPEISSGRVGPPPIRAGTFAPIPDRSQEVGGRKLFQDPDRYLLSRDRLCRSSSPPLSGTIRSSVSSRPSPQGPIVRRHSPFAWRAEALHLIQRHWVQDR